MFAVARLPSATPEGSSSLRTGIASRCRSSRLRVFAEGSPPLGDAASIRSKWKLFREERAAGASVCSVRGRGKTLELDKEWSLQCDVGTSSSFAESVTIRLPSGNAAVREYRAAFDETKNLAWQDDMSGLALQLESEDVDRHLLSTWLRTGQARIHSVFSDFFAQGKMRGKGSLTSRLTHLACAITLQWLGPAWDRVEFALPDTAVAPTFPSSGE